MLRTASAAETPDGETPGKRILVVDDERHIVRLIQLNLERAGYEVWTAFDGKEAMEKVESEKPDLVILDVMLPYTNGFEVLQTIRKNADTRETPAIMLLTKAEQADMFLGWSGRADVFLTKPFNPMELIVHVKRLLRTLPKDEDDGGWPPNNGWFSTS